MIKIAKDGDMISLSLPIKEGEWLLDMLSALPQTQEKISALKAAIANEGFMEFDGSLGDLAKLLFKDIIALGEGPMGLFPAAALFGLGGEDNGGDDGEGELSGNTLVDVNTHVSVNVINIGSIKLNTKK